MLWPRQFSANRLSPLLGLGLMTLAACGGDDSDIGDNTLGNTETTTSGSTTNASGTGGSGGAGGTAPSASSTTAASSSSAGPGGAGGGTTFEPEPIPNISDEPPVDCGAQKPGYFQFLDDTCNAKKFPSVQDRDQACPVLDTSATVQLTGGGSVTYQPSSAGVNVDTTALAGIVPSELTATVILIRRVNGVPHYRYLSTGDHNVAYQPWSTTKWLAAANAAATLRIKSNYKVGLEATVDSYPLGDLISSIHAYDNNPYTSNSLGRYFHNIGGRSQANDLIHNLWLKRPANETFGGNYGAASPPLGYVFKQGNQSVTIQPDQTSGPANHLSSFTMAEALKRIVLHREEATQRLPGIQWADIKVLLFGAQGSSQYGKWGGMTRDTTLYLQVGHDIDYIEKRSAGRWNIFSKLGLGTKGQFLNVGYACMPVLDDAGNPVPGWGREFVIASHLPTGGSSWAQRDRNLAKAHRTIIKRIVDGRL